MIEKKYWEEWKIISLKKNVCYNYENNKNQKFVNRKNILRTIIVISIDISLYSESKIYTKEF